MLVGTGQSGGKEHVNWAATKPWLTAHWSIGQLAAMASMLEASAPKAGNVHPSACFSDMDFTDFLAGGLCLAPVIDLEIGSSVGTLVRECVSATRKQLARNTNLGTVLLIAPLAKAMNSLQSLNPERMPVVDRAQSIDLLKCAVTRVLEGMNEADSVAIYSAIRTAQPGGLGRHRTHDIRGKAPTGIRDAMAMASDRDAVARQYVNGFEDVCDRMAVWLRNCLERGLDLPNALCEIQLRWLSLEADGLIVRKVGPGLAKEAQQLSEIALLEWLETGIRGVRWQALDTFLRADGHRRNPGTTADLIAAAIFVVLFTFRWENRSNLEIDDEQLAADL